MKIEQNHIPKFVVATEEEKKRLVPESCWNVCIVTGIGYANVFRSLQDVPRSTPLVNIGYAGSNKLPIGSIRRISVSRNYHPNCVFQNDPEYVIKPTADDPSSVPCYTSGDFVTETDITEPVVFDMELYAIFAMGFTSITAIKVITDNLSAEQYEQNTGGTQND